MNIILILAFILLAGLIVPQLIDRLKIVPRRFRFKIPAVTVWLLIGILIGRSVCNLIPEDLEKASFFISSLVLGIIAFSLGQNFTRDMFKKMGKVVMWVSIMGAVGPWILVTLGLTVFLKTPFYISLIFGAIATATAPAASIAVVREAKAKGYFTDVLLGVVAIDDAWCLIIFALSLAVSKAFLQHVEVINGLFMVKVIFSSVLEIVGALILGGVVSIIFIKLSRFAHTPAELLTYTLGLILLTTGLAIYLGLSVLLTNMCLGAFLVNIEKASSTPLEQTTGEISGTYPEAGGSLKPLRHRQLARFIKRLFSTRGQKEGSLKGFTFLESLRIVETPLYLIFFVLAGASFELYLLLGLSWMGLVYIFFRAVGKIGGATLGGILGRGNKEITRFIGWGLLPQAGVAMGAALMAKSVLPSFWGDTISTIIIASTVFYELIGPVFTRIALEKAGDISLST